VKIEIRKVEQGTELAAQLADFVAGCSWEEVKEHIEGLVRQWQFTEWETPFVAMDDGQIVGMTTLMKTDYYPLPEIYPWVSCVFVTESHRGQRISGMLIEYANQYAETLGFQQTYIPSEHVGLYEKYGYRYVREIVNYGGGTDRLYVRDVRG